MTRGREQEILVRLPNWIGDAVMAYPALLFLAHCLPAARIHLLGPREVGDLFLGLDDPFDVAPALPSRRSRFRHLMGTLGQIRAGRADAALLLTPAFSAALQALVTGIPVRAGWGTDGRRLLLNAVPEAAPTRTTHLRVQYLELAATLARSLGATIQPDAMARFAGRSPRLPLRAEELDWAAGEWRRLGIDPLRTIALAPGATYGVTKRWPPSHFARLDRLLAQGGWERVWIGGPGEVELTERLAAECPGSRSLAGCHGLRQTLAFMSRIRALVSNDSGALHLGNAAGCPVVGIFGSTSPSWTGPAGPDDRVVQRPTACSPCFARTCPTAVECLTEIAPEDVARTLEEAAGARRRGRPAVFLDRDGTLIDLVPYLARPEEVKLAGGAEEALGLLASSGFLLVLVTNQSLIARGGLDRAGLHRVHRRLAELLAASGAPALDAIEFCPHHPDLAPACLCRKPAPGLLLRAAHHLGIDLERSWMIGDRRSDLDAGRAVGAGVVLVRTGYGKEEEREDQAADGSRGAVADDLVAAARYIVREATARGGIE